MAEHDRFGFTTNARDALKVGGKQIPAAWKSFEFMRPALGEFQARTGNQVSDDS